MQHPVVRSPDNIAPEEADAFLALVFQPAVDDASRDEPEIWPISKDVPVEIGETVRFILTDDNVSYHPDGTREPPALEIAISENADEAFAVDLSGFCFVAVFRDIEEARAWAKTIDDIFDADLPYPRSGAPDVEAEASAGA